MATLTRLFALTYYRAGRLLRGWEPPHLYGGRSTSALRKRDLCRSVGFSRGRYVERGPGLKPTLQAHAFPLG